MPLKTHIVRGRPSKLFLKLLDAGVREAPDEVTITVAPAGAAEGANTIPVTALTHDIPQNTILTFSRAASDPDELTVVVTEDAEAGATELSVEMFEGEEGEGLSHTLADGDDATWDQLLTAVAVTTGDLDNNPQTQQLGQATWGSGTGVQVLETDVTTISPALQVNSEMQARAQLTKDIIRHGDSNRFWYARAVTPDEDGNDWLTEKGIVKVSNVQRQKPADNLVTLNYTVTWQEMPDRTFADEVEEES